MHRNNVQYGVVYITILFVIARSTTMANPKAFLVTFFLVYFSTNIGIVYRSFVNVSCSSVGGMSGKMGGRLLLLIPPTEPQLTFTKLFFDICKIVLPNKLRYLENMLNSEVMAKVAKIRQRIEANPNIQDSEKSWPLLLAQYQADDQRKSPPSYKNFYSRHMANFK